MRVEDAMRKAVCWLLWMSLVGWAWGQQASSNSGTVPTVIRFSGNLVDADGKPLSGVVGVTFSLYKDERAGAPLWVETQNVPADKSGHYAVTLGSTTTQGLPQGIFASGEARWLGVQPQGQAEQPRVLLMSVPYALKAGDAETVGGLPASAFVAASSAGGTGTSAGSNLPPVSGGGKPGFIASWKTATQLTNSKLFQSAAGNIGVDTAKPVANFDVNGTAIVRNTLTLFPNGSAPTLTVKGTVFSVSNTGLVSFVSGQNFPGTGTITGVNTAKGSGLTGGGTSGTLNLALTNSCSANQVLQWNGSAWACSNAGTGTITGVTAGTDLTGGGTSGNVTLNLDTTKVPQLNAANTFNGYQTVNGNLSATGVVAGSSFWIGSNPFALGSYADSNVYLGFSGYQAAQGIQNTAIGEAALNSNAGSYNTASGNQALTSNTTGNYNTASGVNALYANTTGGNNTATGVSALTYNTTGANNAADGYNALYANTTGGNNTATGYEALYANQTGAGNAADGSEALNSNSGSYNTASGYQALRINTIGNYNTASGYQALGLNARGNYNTASGYGALGFNTTGSSNTAFGYGADVGSEALTNATAIGANAQVASSNALVLGSINGVNGATSSTNVGIGTTTPASTLDVHGTGNFTGLITFASGQTFPGTGTITGVTTGTGSGLTGGGTSGTLNLALTNGCTANQVLQWSGSMWVCSNAGTGTITGVFGGTDLTGQGTSGNVTLNLDTTKVPQLGTPNMFAGTQTIAFGDLSITGGSLDLPQTGKVNLGVVNMGGVPFMHACCYTTDKNTYVGANAGSFSPNSGGGNVALGYGALQIQTNGADNTAVGALALNLNTGGNANVAVGSTALQSNQSGGDNTGVGVGALILTTGALDTALGQGAGAENTDGNNNTFIGAGANPPANSHLKFATAIGSNATVGEDYALVLGGTGNNAVKVGIGTAAPAYTLDVQGTGNFTGLITFAPNQTFPGAGTITAVNPGLGMMGGGSSGSVTLGLINTCSNGQVLTWNGSMWVCTGLSGGGTITGVTAGTDLTGGGTTGTVTLNLDTGKVPQLATANSFTGNQSVTGNVTASGTVTGGTVNTSTSFNLGGTPFAFGSAGSANAFLGFSGNLTTTGASDTAVGYLALAANTYGQYNTAAGAYALTMNNSGPANTADGFQTLQYNTTGAGNTASGADALSGNTTGGFNTASGYQSLQSNSAGSYNTATGYQALQANTSGYSNTASGYKALVSNTSGIQNIADGMLALGANTTGYYNTAVGYGALQSNIGGTVNTALGHLADVSDGLTNATAIGAEAKVTISNALVLGRVRSFNTTFVGIGTTAPTNIFTIGQNKGNAIADGWTVYSSRRWKTNIHTLHGALAKVEQLRGVSYDLKASGKHEVGVIAEEVGAVVPEIVSWEKNGKDAQGVDYSRLTALLIEATKEQQALIHKQQDQIKAQQAQIKAQRAQSELQRAQSELQQAQIAQLTSQVNAIQASLKTNNGTEAEVRTATVHVPAVVR
jgi:trimeric autotransporter adhesin